MTGLQDGFLSVQPLTAAGVAVMAVALIALILSAFISGSETAFFSLSESEIDSVRNEKKRTLLERVLEKPERLLATFLIMNNLVNVMIVVLCCFVMNEAFAFGNRVLGLVIEVLVLTLVLLLFGDILPKIYAKSHHVRWALSAVRGVYALCRLFGPAAKLMALSSSIVNKVVPKKSDDLSLDDLSHALEITDVSEAKDKNMLEEILKFGGKAVSEIMTPRIDITDVDMSCSFSELLEVVKQSGFSRIPVYDGNQDNIKGVIYAKDLLPYIGERDDTFKWQILVRPPFFVPETRMIDDILEDFRRKKMHMAIVVDEYGGTEGLVTLEDVLEEIVGEINDEYDQDESFYTRLSNDTYLFEGKTLLNDFYRVTDTDEDEFKEVEEDAETIAGLLLNIKHDFPKDKEVIEYGRFRFMVDGIDKHRIVNVKVQILSRKPEKSDKQHD